MPPITQTIKDRANKTAKASEATLSSAVIQINTVRCLFFRSVT
ncbi:MAG TPA: hypothetical protein PK230_15220 [Chitinophagales bacterium]|nr:hypothetical protein [Chitinophagales bacterium]